MSKQPMTERSIEEEQLCFCLMLLKAKENDKEGKQEVTVSLANARGIYVGALLKADFHCKIMGEKEQRIFFFSVKNGCSSLKATGQPCHSPPSNNKLSCRYLAVKTLSALLGAKQQLVVQSDFKCILWKVT